MKTIAKWILDARIGIGGLKKNELELREAHREALLERKRIIGAKLPKAELVKNAATLVDETGARWRRDHGAIVIAGLSSERPVFKASDITFEALCGLAPQVIKESLAAMVNSSDVTEGLPRSERPKALRDIDARIDEIERGHTSLVEGAAEAGLSLELLPAVVAKRNEARRREETARQQEASWAARFAAETGESPFTRRGTH